MFPKGFTYAPQCFPLLDSLCICAGIKTMQWLYEGFTAADAAKIAKFSGMPCH